MAIRNNIDNLYIDKIDLIEESAIDGKPAVQIIWSCNLGFGVYTLIGNKDGTISADSEYMDRGENKEFLKALFDKIIEKVVVE